MGTTPPGTAEGKTLWEMLRRRTELTPDRLMLADEHDRRFTFGEVAAWSERVAAGLIEMGISDQSVVSWQLPTRIETVVLSLALARIGAVQNPVIHLYREREVGSLLRTTNASWYMVPGVWNNFDYAAMGESMRSKVDSDRKPFEVYVVVGGLPEADPSGLAPIPTDGEAVKWLYSTSGTTSEPKAVRHSDGTLIAGGVGLSKRLQPAADDMGSIAFPYAHIGGPDYLVMMLHSGLPAVLVEAFAPPLVFEIFRHHGVTITGGSTAHYLAFMADQAKHPDEPTLPSLRYLSGGGAPMPPEVYWRTRNQLDVQVRHGYGMTECPMISNGGVGDDDEQLANTAGAPIEGCEVMVVDADEQAVGADVDGDILVRGAMVAKGYLNPGATQEAFRADGFFRTGDRGHLRADNHLVLTGRSKELIIRKGENISPTEIEDVLMTHPSIAAVAVIGLPDERSGERVCAVVETVAGHTPITFEEMAAHCRAAGLMIQKVPEQLELMDALPRNPTMKILKRVLVEQLS
jgi:acyl-coenzyme A synthetase/AMP-(fatty) acid ligase